MGDSWLPTCRWEAVDCLQMGDKLAALLTDGRQACCLQIRENRMLTDGRKLTSYRWETAGCLQMRNNWLSTDGRQLAAYMQMGGS